MTQVDLVYRYGVPPTEAAAAAIARLREVYGVRRVQLSEREQTVLVEYDSSRLTAAVIEQMLRRAGLELTEKVQLFKDPPPPASSCAGPHGLTALSQPSESGIFI